MNANTIILLILTGIAAGILSGLVGIGGGIIMVPMLVWIGFSQHQAQGTSLAVLSVPVTLLAAMNYYKEGYLNWKYALIIAVFFVVGGFIGSKLSVSMDEGIIKKVFGVILLFVAGKMILGK